MGKLLIIVAAVLTIAASSLAAPPPDAAIVIMEGTEISLEDINRVIDTAAESGGRIYHVMPVHTGPAITGCVQIGSIMPGQEGAILAQPFVTRVERGPVDPLSVVPLGEEAVFAVNAWNYLLVETEEPLPPGVEPLFNDALVEPPGGGEMGTNGMAAAPQAAAAPGQSQTSEFMIGKIAIGVVLPESTGSGENWSNGDPLYPGQNRQQLVYNKIVSGANWWATQGGTAAGLTFYYDQKFSISTTYEPITVSSANYGETAWVSSVLNTMGYTSGTAWDRARAYDNAIRTSNGTDWAFSIFVADSLNDADGMFPNGTCGFAYLYGPYMVLTYDNDGWALSRMNQVFAHEMAHIFGAPDEYQAPTCTCTAYGYLGVTNGNCVNCTGNQQTCLMVNNTLQICNYTKGHVGWQDSDADGILDPVDTTPAITASLNYGPFPPYSANSNISGQGTAYDNPCPSPTRTPVTINRITGVLYNIDAGFWLPTTPTDGAFNSDSELFSFTSGPHTGGPHVVALMATNNRGNTGALGGLNISIDTTPPPPPLTSTILEAPYSSKPNVATVQWAAGLPDPESGTASHRVMLWQVTPPLPLPIAQFDVPAPGPVHQFLGLLLMHGMSYQAAVHAINGAGILSTATTSVPNLTVDLTPPIPPVSIIDGGAGTNQLNQLGFSWPAGMEDVSGIAGYQLEISDDTGLVVGTWNTAGLNYTASGLGLLMGRKYFGRVLAVNRAGTPGVYSPYSNGIMAVQFFSSIADVKKNAGAGAPVGINQVYVTSAAADEPGVVFVEQGNRVSGIKTDSTDPATKDTEVQVAGIVSVDAGPDVFLQRAEVEASGGSPRTIRPFGVTGRALGGGAFGLQQGAPGSSGLNNIGLFVRTWGLVTFSMPPPLSYFVVDDGSGMIDQTGMMGIGVKGGNINPPAPGAYVSVQGICSMDMGFPVVLLRQSGDWW